MGSESRCGHQFVQAKYHLGLHDYSAFGRSFISCRSSFHSGKNSAETSMKAVFVVVSAWEVRVTGDVEASTNLYGFGFYKAVRRLGTEAQP